MDSVFGIGFPELVLIMLLAGIVMGPQRIRQVARWLGFVTVKLQGVSRAFMRQLNAELDSVDGGGDLRGAMQDVKDLRQQVDELRRELAESTRETFGEGQKALTEGWELLNQSIAPPMFKKPTQKAVVDETAVSEGNGVDASAETPSPLPKIKEVPDDPE